MVKDGNSKKSQSVGRSAVGLKGMGFYSQYWCLKGLGWDE